MKKDISPEQVALIKEFFAQKITAKTTKKVFRIVIARLIKFLRSRYGNTDFTKLNSSKAEHFIGYIVCGGVKPAYVNHFKYASEAFYDFLLKKGIIKKNPFSEFMVSVKRETKTIYLGELRTHYDRCHPRALEQDK